MRIPNSLLKDSVKILSRTQSQGSQSKIAKETYPDPDDVDAINARVCELKESYAIGSGQEMTMIDTEIYTQVADAPNIGDHVYFAAAINGPATYHVLSVRDPHNLGHHAKACCKRLRRGQ